MSSSSSSSSPSSSSPSWLVAACQHFRDNKATLLSQYSEKWIVLVDREVRASGDTEDDVWDQIASSSFGPQVYVVHVTQTPEPIAAVE